MSGCCRLITSLYPPFPVSLHHRKPGVVLFLCLTEADKDIKARQSDEKLVLDLSGSKLSFEHIKYFATWLHVPARNVHLHALDLSNNRIFAADWESFLPLVERLSSFVAWMDFSVNDLPPIDKQAATLTRPVFSTVSLGLAHHGSTGDKWADSWNDKTREFKRIAYGISADGCE